MSLTQSSVRPASSSATLPVPAPSSSVEPALLGQRAVVREVEGATALLEIVKDGAIGPSGSHDRTVATGVAEGTIRRSLIARQAAP